MKWDTVWNWAGAAAPVVLASAASAQLADPIPATIDKGIITVRLEPLAGGFNFPVDLQHTGNSSRLFVASLDGKIALVENGVVNPTPFLDISATTVTGGERGLSSFTFHPNFNADLANLGYGKVYTVSSQVAGTGTPDFGGPNHNHQSILQEWRVSASNPNMIDTSVAPRPVMRINHAGQEHTADALRFGPDGLLYFALGDGGNNPLSQQSGPDNTDVYGSILRIDVDGRTSANGQYSVPASNPFVGASGLDEVYAYGFRNPYRISFDGNTLYAADVGQSDIEEVNLITSGGNYGWNSKEGTFHYRGFNAGVDNDMTGVPAGLTDPIAQYDHDEGNSIIGGYVYRGSLIPELNGKYVFGDFDRVHFNDTIGGRLFYMDAAGGTIHEFILSPTDNPVPYRILSFGQDADGEMYLLNDIGQVLRIVPEPGAGLAMLVLTLAAARRRRRG